MKDKYGSWCLLAGAAEGLGEAFAVALAQRGMDIIMVDHQEDKLQVLAERLEQKFRIRTRKLSLDLAEADSIDTIMKIVEETSCRMLIYNAAFSRIKKFEDNSPEDLDRYIQVNTRTPLHLAHRMVNLQEADSTRPAGIVLMASLAGLWGSNFLAPYGATKAFNIVLAEALHHEFHSRGVDVMACVAGPVSTPAYLETRPEYGRIRPPVLKPGLVAEEALRSLGKKSLHIPGRMNRFNYFLMTRILSRKRTARIFSDTTKKMYRMVT